jgi:Arc/MetJ family transcription regulator
MGSRKTSVAIDEELLSAAKEILRTRTVKATIEMALLELLRAKARREEIEALSTLRGMDLARRDVMSRAWRR